MERKDFILATSGHVDHGKSALVKALTGTDPDRLPEEKERGITIDLGFATFELPAGDCLLSLGVIDVPGHEDFVKNMAAGVGGVDLALLLVAADDGWMPQTEEHLQILTYLGVTRAIVVLSKIDLNRQATNQLCQTVRGKLKHSPFSDSPILPISTLTGEGISELKATLISALKDQPPPRDLGKPRLGVDRAFSLKGVGTIVTGTLIGGKLAIGDTVTIQPAGIVTRIRSLQNHHQITDHSGPGRRTALNLADVEVGRREAHAKNSVSRGEVITRPDSGFPTKTPRVLLERTGRNEAELPGLKPIRNGLRVRIHLGATYLAGRIHLPKGKGLASGEKMRARLELEVPLFCFIGDRFLVRDWAEQRTLAGGVILGLSEKDGKESGQEWLRNQEIPDCSVDGCLEREISTEKMILETKLLVQSVFSAAEIQAALEAAIARGQALRIGGWVIYRQRWEDLRKRVVDAVNHFHQQQPQAPGFPLTEARRLVADHLPVAAELEIFWAELGKFGIARNQSFLRQAEFRPRLPGAMAATGEKIRMMLEQKLFDPPAKRELMQLSGGEAALKFLKETREVIELPGEVVLLQRASAQMQETILAHLRERGMATVSELRQKVGTTRRVIMPLLEQMDKEGWTVREGDQRKLGRKGDSERLRDPPTSDFGEAGKPQPPS